MWGSTQWYLSIVEPQGRELWTCAQSALHLFHCSPSAQMQISYSVAFLMWPKPGLTIRSTQVVFASSMRSSFGIYKNRFRAWKLCLPQHLLLLSVGHDQILMKHGNVNMCWKPLWDQRSDMFRWCLGSIVHFRAERLCVILREAEVGFWTLSSAHCNQQSNVTSHHRPTYLWENIWRVLFMISGCLTWRGMTCPRPPHYGRIIQV